MDISKLNAGLSAGADMVVKHPGTNEPILDKDKNPHTITLLSADHPDVRDISRKAVNDFIKSQTMEGTVATVEDAEGRQIEQAVAATIGWNIEYGDGPAKCDAKTKYKIYREQPWLLEQVTAFIAIRANFIKA